MIAGRGDIDAAAMLGVAFSTGKLFRCASVMWGPIVAIEAGRVGSFRGKGAGLLDVAGGALSFENGMRFGEAAAAVNAGVFGESAFGDPDQRQQRQQEAQPEFRAL